MTRKSCGCTTATCECCEGTRRRTVAFGRRIATVAWLRDENGRPITGASVTVLDLPSAVAPLGDAAGGTNAGVTAEDERAGDLLRTIGVLGTNTNSFLPDIVLPTGAGVVGAVDEGQGQTGVYGVAPAGIGVRGRGRTFGVLADLANGNGVALRAEVTAGLGVFGNLVAIVNRAKQECAGPAETFHGRHKRP